MAGLSGVLLVGVVAGTLAAPASGCRRAAPVHIEKQGVALRQLDSIPEGLPPVAQARSGDWSLKSDRINLVVAADDLGQTPAGALVDAVVDDLAADELEDLSPLLMVDGEEVPLELEHIEPVERDQRPALSLERRSTDGQLALWTELSIAAGQPYVTIRHRLYNRSQVGIEKLRFGERVRWPGAPAFVPGQGWASQPSRSRAAWLGRAGTRLAYALVWPEGPAEIVSRFEPHGPLDQLTWSEPFALAPGATRTSARFLVLKPGSLADVAPSVFRLLKVPTGTLRIRVSGGAGGQMVEAARPGEGPTLAAPAGTTSRLQLALPEGRYVVTGHTAGGDVVQPIEVDLRTPVDLDLIAPRPGYLGVRVTDGRRQPLPARLTIRGVWPTRDPVLGPPHRASGAGNIVYTPTGDVEVALPAGKFEVTASRGMEYGIAREAVRVARNQGTSVRLVLDREVDTIGWIGAELHLHAEPSPDSEVSLEDRITSLLAEGVEFAVGTDHNHVTDYGPDIRSLAMERALSSAPGVEITTWAPRWGHFNVFPFPVELGNPVFDADSPKALFAALRSKAPGALIQVNHPRMEPGIGYFNLAGFDPRTGGWGEGFATDFDAIEVLNGMELGRPELYERNLADWFALLSWGRRYTATGSSDSHRLIYEWAGTPRTYVQVRDDRPEAVTADEVALALRSGRAMVTTGPFLVVRANGGGPGDLAAAPEGRVVVQVSARAARWVDVSRLELVVNGETVATHRIGRVRTVERALWQHELVLARDAWLVVLARGERPLSDVHPHSKALPLAFTNPVFLDVDGDGAFQPPLRPSPQPRAAGDAQPAGDGPGGPDQAVTDRPGGEDPRRAP